MKNKTIFIISPAFPPIRAGGSEYCLQFARALAERQYDVHVLTNTAAKDYSGMTVHNIMSNWSWQDALDIIKLVWQIKPKIVDIYFSGWMYNDHPMITFLPSLIKMSSRSCSIVTHIESLGGVDRGQNQPNTALMRTLLSVLISRKHINYEYGSLIRDSDAVLLLSQRDWDKLHQQFPIIDAKCKILRPPPLLPVVERSGATRLSLRRELGIPENALLLCYFGYVYPGKGIEFLLQAMTMTEAPLYLVVIGGAPETYVLKRAGREDYPHFVRRLAKDLGIAGRVKWLDYQASGSDRPSQMIRASDICVLPFESGLMQHNSSFSFAAAHGIPIISTQSSETDPIFSHGHNVFLCEPADAASLALAIERIIVDDEMREGLAEGALRLSQEHMSLSKAIDETIAVYEGIKH